jgi:hypothetical protein
VFQFDFLNDDFSKLPQGLQNIINNEKKRKKLVVYINPPYAEASSYGTESIPQVANTTKVFDDFKTLVGAESLQELSAQFIIRINNAIPNAKLATFSSCKYLVSTKFQKFRNNFKSEFKSGFVCISNTFDNVDGVWPLGFFIWNLENKQEIKETTTDVFLTNNLLNKTWNDGVKTFYPVDNLSIADWRKTFYSNQNTIGHIIVVGPSIQSNNNTFITNNPKESYVKKGMVANISSDNFVEFCVYFSVRHCIDSTWLNNQDRYLYPNDGWLIDSEFRHDCLAYTLFSNNIQSRYGVNNWIPFTEKEVNARDKFESNFMANFIANKKAEVVVRSSNGGGSIGGGGYSMQMQMFKAEESQAEYKNKPRKFSAEAQTVFDAGRELWKYYHTQPNCNVNASLYDIREHFQGRNDKGKMNNASEDEKYTELIGNLRDQLKILAKKIEQKVYEYEFLKK